MRRIWHCRRTQLDTNIKAHYFIPKEYWTDNYEMVRNVLPQAEIYVYENDATRQIDGFIGLSNDHIERIKKSM